MGLGARFISNGYILCRRMQAAHDASLYPAYKKQDKQKVVARYKLRRKGKEI
jgi:hypothetical protein